MSDRLYEDVDPEDLPEQSRELFCEDHEMFHVKDAYGNWVCPFCEAKL